LSDIPEPSEISKTGFTKQIAEKILIELDEWQLITKEDPESNESNEIFIDTTDEKQLKNVGNNKEVTIEELEHFYNASFEEALTDTNRYDISDLDHTLQSFFVLGVIKLTASNIWLKYNTSVTVNNEEGIIDYGQGGKLYKKYQKIISKFVRSELIGLSSL
jgi:hypothetical protein